MTFGDRIKRTSTAPGATTTMVTDDSPDATALILLGHPIACPTCGSHTRLAQNSSTGWLCQNPACTFSTDISSS